MQVQLQNFLYQYTYFRYKIESEVSINNILVLRKEIHTIFVIFLKYREDCKNSNTSLLAAVKLATTVFY